MNEVIWRDRFNIGVEVIDKAHQRLFSIVGKLLSLNEDTAKQQHACREGIKYFKSYTLKHFAEEEAYMQSIQYSEYDMHKSLHDNLRDNTLPALERELDEQNYSMEAIQHFLGICVGWLNGHIMIEDHAITGRTSNKWVHQASDDELISLEKAIQQTFQNLYRVNAELISKRYGGEDFSSGTALCYRLNYKSKEGKLLQVFLIYEEQMILRTLSAMLGKQIKGIDKTVIYALKVLSQKFIDCIGSHFALTNACELQKDDIMTFEQLVRTFDKEYPPYSLLFNIENKGYFAFCAR
ncbi:MAG: hemerythrin domain-containing protein [Lachnospiraceae bacterium]|nr:hemerythrin domain-containing protein [Lachnospiraceae bacterium]